MSCHLIFSKWQPKYNVNGFWKEFHPVKETKLLQWWPHQTKQSQFCSLFSVILIGPWQPWNDHHAHPFPSHFSQIRMFYWQFHSQFIIHCGLKNCYVFWKVMHKTYTGHETRTKTVWETRFIQILGFPVWPKNLFKVGLSK